jgi:hypothetical protein
MALIPSSRLKRFERSKALERLEQLNVATAPMSDVLDVTGQKIAVGARHCLFLREIVLLQKICG